MKRAVATSYRFDAAYYRRYYEDPRTRIYPQARHAKLVQGVVGLAEYFGVTLRTVLDVGAGVGWWRAWLAQHRPRVKVVSTELEADVCARYGHVQADVVTLSMKRRFDLVVCQGVLPYVRDVDLPRAVANLAGVTDKLLYLEAATKEDLAHAVDAEKTDMHMLRRPARAYRAVLRRYFRELGCGLWASRASGLTFFALEAPVPARAGTLRLLQGGAG